MKKQILSQWETDLRVPVKSFRVFALIQIIREGEGPETLELLDRLRGDEEDEECLQLFDYAVVAVRERSNGKEDPPVPANPVGWYPQASSAERMRFLLQVTPEMRRTLTVAATRWLDMETDFAVSAIIIRTFGAEWPRERISQLSSRLFASSLSIRTAALEALLRMDPQLLANHLPPLLDNPDLRIRALAVQGLARIDLEEALQHVERMFSSENPYERICALQNSVYLPFSRVRTYLLEFIAKEEKGIFLEKAGNLLTINADPDLPFSLAELAEMASPEKARQIRSIIDEAIKTLAAIGAIEESVEAFQSRLAAWMTRFRIRRALQDLLSTSELNTGDARAGEFLAKFSPAGSELLSILAEAECWELSPIQRRTFEMLKNPDTQIGVSAQASPGDSGVPGLSDSHLTLQEVRRQIISWGEENKEEAAPQIRAILIERKSDPDLCAVGVRTATRLKIAGLGEIVEPFLQASHERLVAAAIDYLGAQNDDRLGAHLDALLQSPCKQVRQSAAQVICATDSSRGLSLIRGFLDNSDPETRRFGLSCLVFVAFSTIRPLLFSFLKRAESLEEVHIGFSLFLSNPDVENLYILYALEQLEFGEKRKLATKTRRQTEKILIDLGRLTQEQQATLNAQFVQRLKSEQAQARVVSPYTRKTNVLASPPPSLLARFGESLRAREVRRIPFQVATVLLVAGLAWNVWGAFAPGDRDSRVRAGPLAYQPSQMEGKVLAVVDEGRGLLLLDSSNSRIRIIPEPNRIFSFHEGDRVSAVILPFRFTPEGIILARAQQVNRR